ncbi:hypothetical protein [Bradyrhizobium sp. F1.13.3]|uniref:hypothetical protein n=1 Tax=Bradyrhizobium sp. F1.13.3 TaxID=3156351 RepID=UPI0033975F62
MRGRGLKAKYSELLQRHNCKPISRPALALLSRVDHAQVVEGICSSSAVDAERLSFRAGSLSWGALDTIPLLRRHAGKPVGQILQLDYSAGVLRIKARVDDPQAAQMPAFSIAAQIIESELRNANSPTGWHFVVNRAVITECSMTDRPSCPNAIVSARRDVQSTDQTYDDLIASINRFRGGLEAFVANTVKAPEPEPPSPLTLGPAPARIYGTVSLAAMRPRQRQTSFSSMVAQLKG